MTNSKKKLHAEANRLARETYEDGVTEARLIAIRDRLAELDALIYG